MKKWEATGLVKFVDVLGMSEAEKPERWIKFATNPVGICEAPCIGMCPARVNM